MSDLRQRAVRLLARREHTRAELDRKLAPHGASEEIETVLNELAQSGLQSDARFAESLIRSQAGRLGVARLRQSLLTKGISPADIEAQVANPANELPDEDERARGVWQKKFAVPPENARDWAKQARFLQGRGFSVEIIRKLLKDVAE